MRQVKNGARHFSDRVRVLAEKTGQGHFANFSQLSLSEATGLVAILVPESIAPSAYRNQLGNENLDTDFSFVVFVLPQTSELIADNAGKSGSDQTALERSLYQTSRPQVDIVDRGVNLFETLNDLWRHFPGQIFECSGSFQVASCPVFVVRTETVISSALDVESCQIETGERHRFGLEKMISDLARHKLIQVLHWRNEKASNQLVNGLYLHQHFRVEETGTQKDWRFLLEIF